jgi:hypothetical protein
MFGAPWAPFERAWKNRMRALSLASSIARVDGSREFHA